jgi:pseudouridine-5'-phosphate glycosidase
MKQPMFKTAQDVQSALEAHHGVVVLESTVIAQGLPWPANLETARQMEEAVRIAGGVPATVAIIDGVVSIGLRDEELETLSRSAASDLTEHPHPHATSPPRPVSKANRRDLSVHLARGTTAATTVSATLWLARRFGVTPCIMATGGLGGVHRGAGESFDVSTDLDELARADGALVVCSGFKSILDLGASLEALETRGVSVIGFGTDELPAFTTVRSGHHLEHRVESAEEAATLLARHRELGLPGALVLANPPPVSEAIDARVMESALNEALRAAETERISGKALTPFLLDRIRRLTAGDSLRANRALLVANARLAGELTVAFGDLRDSSTIPS